VRRDFSSSSVMGSTAVFRLSKPVMTKGTLSPLLYWDGSLMMCWCEVLGMPSRRDAGNALQVAEMSSAPTEVMWTHCLIFKSDVHWSHAWAWKRVQSESCWGRVLATTKPNWVEACSDIWLSRQDICAWRCQPFVSMPDSADTPQVGTIYNKRINDLATCYTTSITVHIFSSAR
jgi:hypothetical protein